MLIAGRAFAHGDRVATRLQQMADATGVLGNSRVQLVHVDDEANADLGAALAAHGPARAAFVLVGDLSLMPGVDPSQRLPPQRTLSRRRVDPAQLQRMLTSLDSASRATGTPVIRCTPPLGIQGRIEVPELVELAADLRRAGPVFDLTRSFGEHEPGPLFSNGVDVLDEHGHDLLAHLIYRSLLGAGAPVPPLTPAEARARQVMSALHAWADGDDGALASADAAGLMSTAPGRQLSALQAALALAFQGPGAEPCRLFMRLGPGDDEAPGLAFGQMLCHGEPVVAAPGFEGQLTDALAALAAGDPEAFERMTALAEAQPQRIEAWMALQSAAQLLRRDRNVPALARGRLPAFDGGPVSDERANALLAAGPGGLFALPALLAVGRPYEGALVTGPALRAALRKERLDMAAAGGAILTHAIDSGPCPESWIAQRNRLLELARALADGR